MIRSIFIKFDKNRSICALSLIKYKSKTETKISVVSNLQYDKFQSWF